MVVDLRRRGCDEVQVRCLPIPDGSPRREGVRSCRHRSRRSRQVAPQEEQPQHEEESDDELASVRVWDHPRKAIVEVAVEAVRGYEQEGRRAGRLGRRRNTYKAEQDQAYVVAAWYWNKAERSGKRLKALERNGRSGAIGPCAIWVNAGYSDICDSVILSSQIK